ncbi:hypothetical protein J6590_088809 [Homalodisca vitripennis]|nr:hypothetical protein J6590_088809 [Homalodisca vitripennis]
MRDTCEPTPIKDYECVSRENNQTNSDTNAAGAVAIYRKLSSTSTAEVVQIAITDATRVIKTKGDMCMTEVTCFTANTSFNFILGAVYIHPGASMQDIGMLLWQGLSPYVHNSQYVPPFVQVDSSIPILLCGDLNKNVSSSCGEDWVPIPNSLLDLQNPRWEELGRTLAEDGVGQTFFRDVIGPGGQDGWHAAVYLSSRLQVGLINTRRVHLDATYKVLPVQLGAHLQLLTAHAEYLNQFHASYYDDFTANVLYCPV